MKNKLILLFALVVLALPVVAQVPTRLNFQGKVAVGATPFTGTGSFRFALVDGTGATTFWSNDGTSVAGSQPTAAVSLAVTQGIYSVQLGDTGLTNMTAVPTSVFANSDVRLRVWFDDGTNGPQMLAPDQRIASVAYAMVAGSAATIVPVPDMVTYQTGGFAAGTTYAKNDLVKSSTPDIYFYSLADNNTGNTPETSPTFWTGVPLSELKNIRKTDVTLSSPGFTSLMSIHVTGTNTAGGRIFYTIRATDAGSQIATEEGVIQYLATANSITCTVQTTDKLHLGTVNSGCTPGFFNPASQPGVSIFDNVTFSSPAPIAVHEVIFHIMDVSGMKVRLEP